MRRAVALLLMVSAMVLPMREVEAGVPEIAAPWLDDLARASLTNSGWVILYNPKRCKEVGSDACAFFRMHEYGHILLKHAGPVYTQMIGGRALAEAEADCYAAKNSMTVQVRAAIAFFESKEMIDAEFGPFHGSGRVRAKRLRECRGL